MLCAGVATALVASGAAAQTTATGPVGPVQVVEMASAPQVLLRPWNALDLVAIRMTVPLESADDMEAARVLQHLARPALERGVTAHGATVQLDVDPTRAVYVIEGPAAAFEEYVALLRRAVVEPSVVPPLQLESTRAAVRASVAAERDTPGPLVRARLRRALLGDSPVGEERVETTEASAGSPAALRAFRARHYRPERLRVVVAGPTSPEAVRAAFGDWPRPTPPTDSSADRSPISAVSEPEPDPQALLPWVGLAMPSNAVEPATLAVAARLVRQRLDQAFLRDAEAEFWWTPTGRRALVLLGSAAATDYRALRSADTEIDETRDPDDPPPLEPFVPERVLATITEQLRSTIARTAAQITQEAVAAARRDLSRDILFAARTPSGLAEVVEIFYDRTDDAAGADGFLQALDRADVTAVRQALLALEEEEPLRVEVLP